MSYRIHSYTLCLIAAVAFSIPISRANSPQATINRLETLLATLSDYNYGDAETWKPEMIEIMRSIYQQETAHREAADRIRAFLDSSASIEAKNAVKPAYYTLRSDPLSDSDVQEVLEDASGSPLMNKVANLNNAFRETRNPVLYIKRNLKTESDELRPHVIRLVRGLPHSFRKGSTLFKIDSLSFHNKAQLLGILAAREDPSIHGLAIRFAKGEDPMLRAAALMSLQTIGKAEDTEFLTEMAASWNDPEKSLARNALHRMPGRDVDEAISHLLLIAESTESQLELITAIEKRNIQSATAQLLELASKGGMNQFRAIRAIALTAPISRLEAVIDLLAENDNAKEKRELETAIYRIAFRFADDAVTSSIIRKRMLTIENPLVKESLSSILEKLASAK